MAYTEAQKRASLKYQATLKELKIRMKPEEYERIVEAAKGAETSVRAYCLTAINEKIQRDSEQ